MPSRTAVSACLVLRRAFQKGPLAKVSVRNKGLTATSETWTTTRVKDVPKYGDLFEPHCRFAGKTVLEIGCSRGYLLAAFLDVEPFTAIGADIASGALEAGRAEYGDRIRFVQATHTALPLDAESVDVIYSVDTVEHLSRPREIFLEAHRVLRPGGQFLVQFHPWLGPYGAHLGDVLGFPWPHVLFSMDTLYAAAARVYDSRDYDVPWYHRDKETGQKRPNPYTSGVGDFLNFMTIRGFRRMLRTLPFAVDHFERIGFAGGGLKAARLLRPLAQVPVLNEYFTHGVFCVLRKLAAPREAPDAARAPAR